MQSVEVNVRDEFWKHYALNELRPQEWEALCDGCGQCCLVRHVNEHQVTVFNIACQLLDIEHSRCSDYHNRLEKVPYCHPLTPASVAQYSWLPESCTYRRIERGEDLPSWHPLLVGSKEQMHTLGITVNRSAVHVQHVPRHERHLHIIKTKTLD